MKTDQSNLHFRFATPNDVDLYYKWANDPLVRNNSYNKVLISYENHVKWFMEHINSPSYFFYLFLNSNNYPIGQVRITNYEGEAIIGISIDELARGKGYGSEMFIKACKDFLAKNPQKQIIAYIKKENIPTYKSIQKAGFIEVCQEMVHECMSYKMIKTL